MAIGLGVAMLAVAACGSGATPTAAGPSPAGQQSNSTDLATEVANLLRSQAGAAAYAQLPQGSLGTAASTFSGIWVSGKGKASAQPDLALLTAGVEAKAKTVEEARSKAASAMSAILDALKRRGIADKDTQTRFFNISPEYQFVERTDALGIRRGEQVLVGYIVSNQVAVKVRKLDDVGKVIDDVVKAGGDLTRLQGIGFTIDDPSKLQTQARELAVKDALAKADQMAKAAGVSLGKPFYLNESSFESPPQPFAARLSVAASAGEVSTPISAGELDVEVTVQAAFSITG